MEIPIDLMNCSGYICLGFTPSNPIRLSKDNLFYVMFGKGYKIDELKRISETKISVYEEDQKIIIDFSQKEQIYEDERLGVKDGDTIYVFDFKKYYNDEKVNKLIITKGTCLGNTRVVVIDHEGNIKQEYQKGSIYFCY
jgi:hypothetical protein